MDGGCFISGADELIVADPCWLAQAATQNADDIVRLYNTKPGLWMVFAVVEGVEEVLAEEEDEDEEEEEGDGKHSKSGRLIRQLVLLNDASLSTDIVTTEFINELKWEAPGSDLRRAGGSATGKGAVAEERAGIKQEDDNNKDHDDDDSAEVSISTGQVGVFEVGTTAVGGAAPQLLQRWYDRACELSCLGEQFGVLDVSGAPVGVVCGCYRFGDVGTHRLQLARRVGRRPPAEQPNTENGVHHKDEDRTTPAWGVRILFGADDTYNVRKPIQ